MTKKRSYGVTGILSLFQGIPVFLKILFLGSKPNFPTQRIATTTFKRGTYNDFHPQTNKKSKPNPNPIWGTYSVVKTICKNLLPIITEEKCLSGINFKKTCLCTNFALFCYYLTTLIVRIRKNLILRYDTIISYNARRQL